MSAGAESSLPSLLDGNDRESHPTAARAMLRAFSLLLAILCAGATLLLRRRFPVLMAYSWHVLGSSLVLAAFGARGLVLPGTALEGAAGASAGGRRLAGSALAIAGIAAWTWAPWALLRDWPRYFDAAWAVWLVGTALLAIGLDLAWARWRWPRRPSARVCAVVAVLVVVATVYRLGTFYLFPGESHVTQVEELQVGAMGMSYLMGWRHRWEYLTHTWMAALGIALGGANLFAMRAPFVAASVIKVVPTFVWLRFAVGNAGALVGTALMAFSAWDVTYARVPTNQNTLLVALAFALLAGPARRGRPSAYAWLGFLGGFVLFEYVGYRLVGLFALAGGAFASLRLRVDPWWARLARPLITVVLIAVMGATLYVHLTRTGQMHQFYDGWGRARANQTYYRAEDSLGERLQRLGERSLRALSLFYFSGDESPVRNLDAEPMTEPITAVLLILGVGYGLANPLRSLGGLTVVALFMTLGGTLVATGNFDPVRAGGTVPFVYGLAGYGAAALLQAMSAAWGAVGRRAAIALLAVGVALAAADDTRFLREFSESPTIRANQFRDVAYLSHWIGTNTRAGETVVALAPGYSYLFEGNDAAWMRGVHLRGAAAWDVFTALSRWKANTEPTLFFVYAGASTPAVTRYLGWLLPEIAFEVQPGPKGVESDIAFAHLPAAPDDLSRRLERAARCPGASGVFEIVGAEGAVLARHEAPVPFVDRSTFPAAFMSDVWRLQAETTQVRATFRAEFRVEQGGDYGFWVMISPGFGELLVDGKPVPVTYEQRLPVSLDQGPHTLELRTTYQPRAGLPSARLGWDGPDTAGAREIVPLYRLGANPECRDG